MDSSGSNRLIQESPRNFFSQSPQLNPVRKSLEKISGKKDLNLKDFLPGQKLSITQKIHTSQNIKRSLIPISPAEKMNRNHQYDVLSDKKVLMFNNTEKKEEVEQLPTRKQFYQKMNIIRTKKRIKQEEMKSMKNSVCSNKLKNSNYDSEGGYKSDEIDHWTLQSQRKQKQTEEARSNHVSSQGSNVNSEIQEASDESLFDCQDEDFLNHQSEMYQYFRSPEYKTGLVEVYSIEDALRDFERKQRQLEQLKFSVLETQKQYPTCQKCHLNHPIYKKHPYVVQQKRREKRIENTLKKMTENLAFELNKIADKKKKKKKKKKKEKKKIDKPAYLSDSSQDDSESLSISEISTNQPDYQAKIYTNKEEKTEDEHLQYTEFRLKELAMTEPQPVDIKFRNDKDQKVVKQDLRNLYKDLTNNMCSYNAQGKIPDELTAYQLQGQTVEDTFDMASAGSQNSNFFKIQNEFNIDSPQQHRLVLLRQKLASEQQKLQKARSGL